MSDYEARALEELGKYIRAQRELAQLSLRNLARLAQVSDSYLSQIERGLYQPSAAILKSIAAGLGIPPDTLYRRLGWLDDTTSGQPTVQDAIAADPKLSDDQKAALLQLYRTLVGR
jgi:transcriptional regulator with XRE-family HTH domain